MDFQSEDLGLLLQRVRQQLNPANVKSWTNILKTARTNMMEKKNAIDADGKTQLRKGIEFLQKFRRVFNRKELFAHVKEVVQSLDASCGFRFSLNGSGNAAFISKAEFYVEINAVEDDGKVSGVFVVHEKLKQESALLKNLLNEYQWNEFLEQIKGLDQFYPDSQDSSIRVASFKSLAAVEEDLAALGIKSEEKETSYKEVFDSMIGIVRPREAGNPLRFLYFLTPFASINPAEKSIGKVSTEILLVNHTEYAIDIMIEGTQSVQSLPKQRLITTKFTEGKIPSLAESQCLNLPARFKLKLLSSLIISGAIKQQLDTVCLDMELLTDGGNYLDLLIKDSGLGIRNQFNVNLLDQAHRYVLDPESHQHLMGYSVSSFYVSQVSDITTIVRLLRKQQIVNAILKSVLRSDTSASKEYLQFFVSVPNLDKIEIVFQSPIKSEDFSVLTGSILLHTEKMEVEIKNFGDNSDLKQDFEQWSAYGSRIFSTTWSIPVTLRSIMAKLQQKYSILSYSDYSRFHDPRKRRPSAGDEEEEGENPPPKRVSNSANGLKMNGNGSKNGYSEYEAPAWIPSNDPRFYKQEDKEEEKMKFSAERPCKGAECLLDIFKETTKCRELIPPRADQVPIKSPIPFYPHNMASAMPTSNSRLHDMLSSNVPPSPANIMGRQGHSSMRGRHHSSSSDTFAEMDSICRFASEAYSGGGHPSTDVEPPQRRTFERKNSIQDVVEFVASGSPFSQPDMSPGGSISSMPPPSQSPQVQQSPQQTPSPSSSIFPPPPKLYHSQSVDLEWMAQQQHNNAAFPRPPFSARPNMRGMDVFEFRDEALQAFQNQGLPPGISPTGPPMPANYPGFQSSPPGRGRGRGNGRRRSKKAPGNVGDRAAGSMDAPASRKPRGGPGSRKPRRPRGSLISGHVPDIKVKFPDGTKREVEEKWPNPLTNFGAVSKEEWMKKELAEAEPPRITGPGLEDSDDSDSMSGDAKLRQQIHDVIVAGGAPQEPPKEESKPSSSNVFEHLQQSLKVSPASADSPSQRSKPPNILQKTSSARKGSLDLIAGKLLAKAGATPSTVSPSLQPDEEGEGAHETFPYRQRNATTELSDDVFTSVDDDEQEKRPAVFTNSPGDGEGIRLVIKKNQLKEGGKPTLMKQKLPGIPIIKAHKLTTKKPVSGSLANDPRSAALQAAKASRPVKKRKLEDGLKRSSSEKSMKAKKLGDSESALKGICFGQSLKGFRIPKVVDEKPKELEKLIRQESSIPTKKPEPSSSSQPPNLQREYTRPPITPTSKPTPSRPPELTAQPPKSILKQQGPTPPPKLQAEQGPRRKTLLPIPGMVAPPVPPRGPAPPWIRPEMFSPNAALHNPFMEAERSPQELRSPDAQDTIQSPDDSGNESKSPIGLNTSKDSGGDRSPGLAIALDVDPGDNG